MNMAASILRARGLTTTCCRCLPASCSPGSGRRAEKGAAEKVEGFWQVLMDALAVAHKDLDQSILARELMGRVTPETRLNSRLPKLVELVL
jgi:hypothetical protein